MSINEFQRKTSVNIQEKANLIWDIATHLVGLFKPHEYGKVILPMTVLKRFDDALAPTKQKVVEMAEKLNSQHIEGEARDGILCKTSGFPFYNTSKFDFKKLNADSGNIESNFDDYLKGFSDNIKDIIKNFKFEDTVKTLVEGKSLYIVVSEFCSKKGDMSPDQVTSADMGYIFEELIRKLSLTGDILDLKEYSKTDYFRFILRKNDIEEPLSEREDILRWGGRWLKWLITKGPLVYRCDVSGKRTSNAIDSSGRLNNGTTIGTRIYSKTLYNRVYHGKYEEYVSSSVSIETELAMICAYYNLYTNRKLKGCGRVFYLGTVDLEMAFPLHFSVKRISEARGKEIVSEDKWLEEKRQIKQILHNRELIWIEFDSVNLGRISTYQARKLTKGESERITGNILKWIDANTVWTENGPKEILWLSELENSHYDDRTWEDKIFGLYHKIIWGEWDLFLKELFNEKIKRRKHIVDKSISEYVHMYRSLVDMENIEEDSEFMAGELFALACILESRYFYETQKCNSYQIRNLFDRYLAQPYTTWILIRKIISGYTNNRSKPLGVIAAQIIEIETDLISNFQFQKMRVLSGKALIGFDVTTEMYWKKRRNENEEYAI